MGCEFQGSGGVQGLQQAAHAVQDLGYGGASARGAAAHSLQSPQALLAHAWQARSPVSP